MIVLNQLEAWRLSFPVGWDTSPAFQGRGRAALLLVLEELEVAFLEKNTEMGEGHQNSE